MSAWIVSQKHIDFIITAAVGYGMLPIEKADTMGATLWKENFKSVNYRYGEKKSSPSYKFAPYPKAIDGAVLLKNIACLEYQSCEHKGWKGSEALKFLDDLKDAAIAHLPGYDAAPWGID